MLVSAVVALLLCGAGSLVVGRAAQLTMRALGLDLWGMLVWFGIAEWPMDELAARRRATHLRRALATD